MFGTKIAIRKELLDRLEKASTDCGCSSVQEFVENALEKELERLERSKKEGMEHERKQKEVDEITEKLKGLGYID